MNETPVMRTLDSGGPATTVVLSRSSHTGWSTLITMTEVQKAEVGPELTLTGPRTC